MTPSHEFHLEPLPETELQSRLVASDGRSSEPVEGRALEAQFHTPVGDLVITSDGNPYEEVLHFILLDSERKILDRISLGQIYHSGMLRDLRPVGDASLTFQFFGDDTWRLTVLPKPRWRLPSLPMSPVRRTRGWLQSSFLLLERE
jgi:hypothetical protein